MIVSSSADESGEFLDTFAYPNRGREPRKAVSRARPVHKLEKSLPDGACDSDDDIISLNVGGRSLLTSRWE